MITNQISVKEWKQIFNYIPKFTRKDGTMQPLLVPVMVLEDNSEVGLIMHEKELKSLLNIIKKHLENKQL